jgi:hypothetical protein
MTGQQQPEPSGFAKFIATGAMLHRLGVFKRQPNRPPRSASDLGEPQTSEAVRALLDAGARNPQIGRVTSLDFDVDVDAAAKNQLRPLIESAVSAEEGAYVSVWIGWSSAGRPRSTWARTESGRSHRSMPPPLSARRPLLITARQEFARVDSSSPATAHGRSAWTFAAAIPTVSTTNRSSRTSAADTHVRLRSAPTTTHLVRHRLNVPAQSDTSIPFTGERCPRTGRHLYGGSDGSATSAPNSYS